MSSDQQQSASSGSVGRPSLGGAPGAKCEQLSILASVEGGGHSASAAGTRRRWPWLAPVVLAVVAVGYFARPMLSLQSPDAPLSIALQRGDTPAAPPVSTTDSSAPLSAHVAGDTAEGSGQATPAHEPARIETVAAGEAAPRSGADDPFARLSAAALAQPEGAQPAKPVALAALPGARPDVAGAAAAAEAHGAEHVAAAAPAMPRAAVPKKRPSPQRATAQASTGDADVDLLAALMAHVSRDGMTAASFRALPTAQPGAHADSATTIAALVRSCSTLSANAARQCRQRICEGYWGKAEACPAKARRAR